MSTIKDVADLAGVSKTTVSKILSGNKNVKSSTLEKVTRAMRELDYVPNSLAQGMRTSKTKTIAVLLPEQYNYGYFNILKGIEESAESSGYTMLVCSTGIRSEKQMHYLREMRKRRVDGMIIFSYMRIEENVKYLLSMSEKIPVVVMDNIIRADEKLNLVRADGYRLTKSAVKYLIDSGRKNIAIIKAQKEYDITSERFEAYIDALKENGIEIRNELIKEGAFESHVHSGLEAARSLMNQNLKPDAIIATTDLFIIGALNYLNSAKIPVPDQVRLIGFDNIDLCNWVTPKLSSISQHQNEVGKTAFRVLLDQIQDPKTPVKQILMDGELIIRET